MNIHKFIIYIAAAFLGISVIFGAAGTGAAAAAARAENAETREYTPGELSDGFYEILLFDEVKGEDGTTHNTSYAQYRVGTDAKGTDTVFGKEIDLTLYSKVYTADELCKLAQNHYYKTNDFYPPNVSYTANKDGTYTICMFEMIEDDGGTPHSATCGWYTVNVCGVGTDDLMMQNIDLNE